MTTPGRSRRAILAGGGSLIGLAAWFTTAEDAAADFEVRRSDGEWRRQLTAVQYDVLRRHGTERPYASPLNGETRPERFACAGCGLPVFRSETKYDSRTGWPSFFAPIENATWTSVDRSFGTSRTEVHCRRCGGHLGHVFDDGPRPTGKRYCMNGAALVFLAA